MKIDMHCHVKEGSIDSKVSMSEYISILKENGFGGMVVTDHNTYKGYRSWCENRVTEHDDFVVLKGVEYDTIDGGHFLVIMPEDVYVPVLEFRGLSVSRLIEIVHKNGGILGPAHPGGEKFMSFLHTKAYRRTPELVWQFDFIEGYNCCETVVSNGLAMNLAAYCHKPVIGGSDAHRHACVGRGYTELPCDVRTESELISLLCSGIRPKVGGVAYSGTTKEKMGSMSSILPYSFFVYNRLGAITRMRKRRHLLHK